ncbi:GatB/YqeY domain-containing protein [Gonapodya prolifera JEL478]|uniref:Altered inheritance of mitochondria protein 41 n=1 Tax=Gonapodya prolifera (strain JEL478) TaxID=1344416 RepID=A0A139AW96_GONPJ|nr:GatB/YqeY domain-containing protein [Gonapodya prolifera JEL478]|eukprot:KXS20979.1 GatB/YqeY domain-containing protein [Gonapodya prolifera JEL478]
MIPRRLLACATRGPRSLFIAPHHFFPSPNASFSFVSRAFNASSSKLSDTQDDLLSRLKSDLKTAMREKSKVRVSVVKSLLSDITYAEKSGQGPPKDLMTIVRKAVKRRQDSIAQYEEAKRDDLAATEVDELAILQTYLPPTPPPGALDELARLVVADLSAAPSDVGKVVKELSKRAEGRWEMKEVADAARRAVGAVGGTKKA